MEGSAHHSVQASVCLQGPLDVARLKTALLNAVSRHEALRTSLTQLPGVSIPVQTIGKTEGSLFLESADGNAQGDPEDPAGSWGLSERPGAVLRVKVVQSSPDKHRLLIEVPSVCADAASLLILINELRSTYAQEQAGAEEGRTLPDPLQYADVSEWLNHVNESEDSMPGLQFWMRSIAEVRQKLPCSKPAGQNLDIYEVQLSSRTAGALHDSSQHPDSDIEALLLTTWVILLEKSGYEVPCIGVAYSGRSSELLRNCIGPLTRHLPLRVHVDKAMPFEMAAVKVSEELAQAAEWQESFDWERFGKEHWSGAGLPYLPFSFEYVNATDSERTSSVTFTTDCLHALADRIGLHLSCAAYNDRVQVRIHWDWALHAQKEIKSIGEGLSVLLDNAITHPKTPSAGLSVVRPDRRKWLLEDLHAPVVFPNQAVPLHELVSAQARKNPEAVALIFDGGKLCYKEVEERAEQVAECLAVAGIGPEDLVAIWMERSPEMIIAMLGILKVGGAYVPVDPQYPEERIKLMLRDSRAKALITQPKLAAQAPVVSVEPFTVEEMCSVRLNRAAARKQVMPENPAYVIYTSGSTGVPKGVIISHRAIVNHMNWMEREFPLKADDCVLQKTLFSFDAAVWEFYAPLIAGSRLVLLRPGGHQDREYLLKCIGENKITVLQLVPSQLRMLLEAEGLKECKSLRRVFCGGEDLPIDLVLQFRSKLPECQLYNLYGPTEAAIDSTWAPCDALTDSHSAPIGRPIANARAYVLDSQGELVVPHLKGELYIAGAGLARGYLHRPDLTAERFVPDPFSRKGGERLYRTGDLVRYREDGQLEFLGRVDHQVKLRGYRIELAEIEVELAKYPGVQQAVAVVREDTAGDKRLVAYVTVSRGTGADAGAMHERLKENLPVYMVPSAIVIVDSLPLTVNGKVDRSALLRLEWIPAERREKPPEGMDQEILCGIFSEVLGRESVSVDDNFFEAGGHSLLATQMISRIRRVFEVDMPLRDLFDHPTVRGLCERIRNARRSGLKPPPLIQRADRQVEMPLSHAQQRLWFLDRMDPGNPAYNVPFAIRLSGHLNVNAVLWSVNEIIRRHEMLRTAFVTRDGTPLQRIMPVAEAELQQLDLSAFDSQERAREISKELSFQAEQPFNLQAGPLLRLKLMRLGVQTHLLAGCLHHIICDGWSISLLAREFSSLYLAYKTGEKPHLPELPIQYVDYALWQREWLQGGMLQEQLHYWLRQLEDLPPASLPLDFCRPEGPNWAANSIPFSIPEELTWKLKRLAQEESATLFMAFLTCWQIMFSRYTGENDVAVGIAISNRSRRELEQLIGCFVNTLVLRTRLRLDHSFRENLADVRHVTTDAQAHQDLPFEVLVEHLQPQREFNRTPLFQAMVVHQHAAALEMEAASLSAELLRVEARASKQDFTLYFVESSHGVTGEIVYRSALFKPASIDRLLRSLEEFMQQVCNDPDSPIAGLQWSSAEESGIGAAFADFLQ